MFDPETWTHATVTGRRVWDEGLWSMQLDVSRDFEPGQFATLGLVVDGEPVKRAYSLASTPGDPLEFYIVEVPDGRLTPSLWRLAVGDKVWVRNKIAGLFTLKRIESGGTLWLVATGTGLAPYVSMVREGSIFDRYEHVVIVQGARHGRQLGYREELSALAADRPLTWVGATTRDETDGVLHGRLTTLARDGQLEAAAGRALAPPDTHVMMCGNPAMILDMLAILKDRGLNLHKPRAPGQVHIEKYW